MSKFETMITIMFAIHILVEIGIVGALNNRNGGGK